MIKQPTKSKSKTNKNVLGRKKTYRNLVAPVHTPINYYFGKAHFACNIALNPFEKESTNLAHPDLAMNPLFLTKILHIYQTALGSLVPQIFNRV